MEAGEQRAHRYVLRMGTFPCPGYPGTVLAGARLRHCSRVLSALELRGPGAAPALWGCASAGMKPGEDEPRRARAVPHPNPHPYPVRLPLQ